MSKARGREKAEHEQENTQDEKAGGKPINYWFKMLLEITLGGSSGLEGAMETDE